MFACSSWNSRTEYLNTGIMGKSIASRCTVMMTQQQFYPFYPPFVYFMPYWFCESNMAIVHSGAERRTEVGGCFEDCFPIFYYFFYSKCHNYRKTFRESMFLFI